MGAFAQLETKHHTAQRQQSVPTEFVQPMHAFHLLLSLHTGFTFGQLSAGAHLGHQAHHALPGLYVDVAVVPPEVAVALADPEGESVECPCRSLRVLPKDVVS